MVMTLTFAVATDWVLGQVPKTNFIRLFGSQLLSLDLGIWTTCHSQSALLCLSRKPRDFGSGTAWIVNTARLESTTILKSAQFAGATTRTTTLPPQRTDCKASCLNSQLL